MQVGCGVAPDARSEGAAVLWASTCGCGCRGCGNQASASAGRDGRGWRRPLWFPFEAETRPEALWVLWWCRYGVLPSMSRRSVRRRSAPGRCESIRASFIEVVVRNADADRQAGNSDGQGGEELDQGEIPIGRERPQRTIGSKLIWSVSRRSNCLGYVGGGSALELGDRNVRNE